MAKQDILLDDDGDLKIEGGDFVIGASEQQEIEALLQVFKTEFKEFPTTGIGAVLFLKKRAGLTGAIKEIKQQLKADGFNVERINIEGATISIDANRNS